MEEKNFIINNKKYKARKLFYLIKLINSLDIRCKYLLCAWKGLIEGLHDHVNTNHSICKKINYEDQIYSDFKYIVRLIYNQIYKNFKKYLSLYVMNDKNNIIVNIEVRFVL